MFCMQNIPFHWCSFTGQQDLPVQPIATGSNGAYPAVLPHGVILWKKHQITVAFTNKTIGFLDDWGLKVDDILEWANRWHELQEEPKYIPRFIGHPSQSVKGADIIVELNGNVLNSTFPNYYQCSSFLNRKRQKRITSWKCWKSW